MTMSTTELERALRHLRLSGMSATLQARALQVANHQMDFLEAFSWLVRACSSAASDSRGSPSARTSKASTGAITRESRSATSSISPRSSSSTPAKTPC